MEIQKHQQQLSALIEGYLGLAKEVFLPLIENNVKYKFMASEKDSIVLSLRWSAIWESPVSRMPTSEPACYGVNWQCMWPEGWDRWKIRSRNPYHPEWNKFNTLVDVLHKLEAEGHYPFSSSPDESISTVHWCILEKPPEQEKMPYCTMVIYYGHNYHIPFQDLPESLQREKELILQREAVLSRIWQQMKDAEIVLRDSRVSDFLSEEFVENLEAKIGAVLNLKNIFPEAKIETLEQDENIYGSHLEECLGITGLKEKYQSSKGKVASYY